MRRCRGASPFLLKLSKKEKIVPENKNEIRIWPLNYGIYHEIYDLNFENWN